MKNILIALSVILLSYSCYAQTFNPTPSINAAGSINTFTGGYTFAYATSGSPWNGALISFGGLLNRYDCQLSTDYLVGNHISFRTHNGDAPNIWNPWYELYHSGNLNNSGANFTAKQLTATGIHVTNGIYSAVQGTYIGWNQSGTFGEVNFVNSIGGGTGGFYFDDTTDGTTFTRLMTIQGNGKIGIGTKNPDQLLTVNGTIHSTSVLVNTTIPLPDYVFKPTYKLLSLDAVKTYIDQNHHLPDMPSADQAAKDGLNLGEMNEKLLKKVEELTLYLIAKDKTEQEQKELNKQQAAKLYSQQAQIDLLFKQVTALSKEKK